MFEQTIALFRYQLLGIINVKIVILLTVVFIVTLSGGQFVAELAIINSQSIALAAMADFVRYSLILLLVISFTYQISQDYELSQFERLLVMPITRVQYVVAQLLVLLVVSLVLVLPVFLVVTIMGTLSTALYWSIATFLEMLLVGQLAMLAIISLEKLPVAVIFTLAVYLLAKLSPIIDVMLTQSSPFYDEEHSFQLASFIFSMIRYVLPDMNAFAQNNMLFEAAVSFRVLLDQVLAVLVFSAFIQFVLLLDFYRKEFNQS